MAVKLAANMEDFTSNLPIMIVDNMGGGSINGSIMRDFNLLVFEPQDETGRSAVTDAPELSTPFGMKIRGASSGGWAKHQYRTETRDQYGEDADFSLLGLPEESDWVLNAPYTDKALIRNSLMFEALASSSTNIACSVLRKSKSSLKSNPLS